MSLFFPRMASFGPTRREVRPFFDLFNDTFNELQRISDNASSRAMWAPKFDLKEEKDKYILEGELPGIEQKNITIDVSDEQTLTIKGHTEHRREEGQRPTEATEVKDGEAGVDGKTPDSKEVATTGPTEVAKRKPEHTYWVSERSMGEFARSFTFPNRVDLDNIKASLKNGILSVVIPKLEKQNPSRRINIE